MEQKGKEPNVSGYLVPPVPCWKGLIGGEAPGHGGCVRVLMARLSAPGTRDGFPLMSCPGSLRDAGQIFSRARTVPFQPVVDGDNLDNTNNEQHIIFLRMYPYTERSLPNLVPLPRRPGVSLCSRRELTSFFPSVRKRWSKVFKR